MNLTSEDLRKMQELANTGEHMPSGDGWFTLQEWIELLKAHGMSIGIGKLRRVLSQNGEIFQGTERKPNGTVNNQFWYKIDFSKL